MVQVTTTSEDFTERNYFDLGIHEVTIEGAVLEALEDGREYIEIGIAGADGQADSIRLFMTTDKAIKYHLRTLQTICLLNAKDEAAKDKVRAAFIGTIDDKKIRSILDKMAGYKAWFQVEQDPVRTYVDRDGNNRPSLNKNIYGYQPTPRPRTRDEMVQELLGASEAAVPVENTDDIPFA